MTYVKYYQGNWIGENCTASFKYDGTVGSLITKGVNIMSKIDKDILENVTDEKINAYIAKQAKSLDSEYRKYMSHKIDYMTILEKDGVFGVDINAIVTCQTRGDVDSDQITFFYPIPGQTGDVVK